MPQLLIEQGTEEWREARKGLVTASIAAACLGLDPWMSRQAAWRAIRGEDKADNRNMRWGRENEPRARAAYECESGYLVSPGGFWVHPVHSWLGCSPDGLVNDDGLLETKCPGKLPERVSIAHRIQMLIQLAVTGRRWCDYFSWFDNDHRLIRVYPAGTEGLIRRLEEFRQLYVLPGVEPPRKQRKKRRAA